MKLLEALVAVAIAALAAGASLWALAGFGKHLAQPGGAARSAALALAQQTLRVAQDAWKYGSPGSAPAGTQAVALPGTITTAISSASAPAQILVTVRYTPQPGRSGDTGVVSVSGAVDVKAPLPGSSVYRPGLVPLPSGAP